MGHRDDGGQMQQLQQQLLHPRLLAALHGAGRLVQDQDSEDLEIFMDVVSVLFYSKK